MGPSRWSQKATAPGSYLNAFKWTVEGPAGERFTAHDRRLNAFKCLGHRSSAGASVSNLGAYIPYLNAFK
jgi:hypothetical protein